MKIHSVLITVIILSQSVVWAGTQPETNLQAIQMESELEWERYQEFPSTPLLDTLVLGGVSTTLAALNIHDVATRAESTKLQSVAAIGYSLAAVTGLSIPMVDIFGHDELSVYRLQAGLAAGSTLLLGSSFGLRAWDYSNQRGTWRDPDAQEVIPASALTALGVVKLVNVIFDFDGRWEFRALRKKIANADELSAQERGELESTALNLLNKRKRMRVMVPRYAGASLLLTGTAAMLYSVTDWSDGIAFVSTRDEHEQKVLVRGGYLAVIGAAVFVSSLADEPLFPMLDKSDINFSIGSSPQSDKPLLLLSGRF